MMKIYEVVAPYAGVNSGRVEITPEQARARRFALEPLGDDLYRVTHATGFKRGEVFGFDGDMPKALALCVATAEPKSDEPGSLEDMDREELLAMAIELGLKPHPNTGTPKLIKAIKERQDQLLAEQEARIAELEANGEDLTPEEQAELQALTGQGEE